MLFTIAHIEGTISLTKLLAASSIINPLIVTAFFYLNVFFWFVNCIYANTTFTRHVDNVQIAQMNAHIRNEPNFDRIFYPQLNSDGEALEEREVLGARFIKEEILEKIDDLNSRDGLITALELPYGLTLTAYIYAFGNLREQPLHPFLKQESCENIIALRERRGAFIEQSAGDLPVLSVLRNFIHPCDNSDHFLSVETYNKEAVEEGMADNVRAFLENDQAKALFTSLKAACSSELRNSSFSTTCLRLAVRDYNDEHPESA